jgi:putative N6-adenine-specific DNA methylase
VDFNKPAPIIIACPNRMSEYLAEEVRDLGYEPNRVFKTGVEVNGTLKDCIRFNLNLRCATQVRYSLRAFRANNPDEVYREVNKMPWEEIIPLKGSFSVSNSADHFTLNNTMFINVRVKDAIVDRFRDKLGQRTDSGKDSGGVAVHLHWKEDHAEVFLDTSGEVISRHGYRRIPGKAPMQESLAAALIRATVWDRATPFINPMCGSGTLAIEAALLATGRKPGLLKRDYSFCHLQDFIPSDLDFYRNEVERDVQNPTGAFKIIASDIRSGAVEDARENARFAGVEDLIEFHCCDYRETPLPPSPGVVVLNPEYGERMGELEQLKQVYGEIGDFFKQKCGGYFGYVFTGNLELSKSVGLKPKRRIEFYSAQLDCRFLEFELYSGTRRIPKPMEGLS